jgi:hypothetical protein
VADDAVQCLPSGALAGNCAALEANIPDAGVLTTGHVTATGCSSSGGPGAAGLLLLAGPRSGLSCPLWNCASEREFSVRPAGWLIG